MRLDPDARASLEAALNDALSVNELRRAVRQAFQQELADITAEAILIDAIAEVVGVAERRDCVDILVQCALRVQPTNQQLADWGARHRVAGRQAGAPRRLVSERGAFGQPSTVGTNQGVTERESHRSVANPVGSLSTKSGFSTRPSGFGGGPSRPVGVPDAAILEALLADVWPQIWNHILGRLGDDAREEVRRRLEDELRVQFSSMAAPVRANQVRAVGRIGREAASGSRTARD